MKRLSHLLLVACAALAVLAAPAAALAQQFKPVAIVSVASLDENLADIGYITRAAGMEDTGRTVRLLAAGLTAGIDRTRPIGLYVVPQAGDFHAVAFLPVSDLRLLLQVHADQIGEPKDVGGGILEIGRDEKAYVKEQAGWAFVAQSQDHLGGLPADPVALLGDLPKKYNVAGRLMIQNVPEELRRMAIDEIKVGMERGLPRGQQPGAPNRQQTEELLRSSVANLEKLINEAEEVLIGIGIDAQARNVVLDVGFSAREGTDLARQMALQQDLKTQFAGLLIPEASVQLHTAGKTSPEDVAQTKPALKALRDQWARQIDDSPQIPADKRGPLKNVLNQFVAILEKTLDSGRMDGGAALVLAPKTFQFVAGGYVADGAAVEKMLKDLVDIAKGTPNFPQVEFNAGAHGDVKLHRLSMPVPDPQAQEVFGQTLEIVVGTGPQVAMVSVGKDAEAMLKKVLDDSAAAGEKTVLPMQLTVSLLPILKFSQSVDDNPMIADLIASLEATGNDKLSITSEAGPRTSTVRIEVQEGIIRLIGNAAKAFGAQFNQQQF